MNHFPYMGYVYRSYMYTNYMNNVIDMTSFLLLLCGLLMDKQSNR
jgi:hypothetical protein